MEKTPRRSFVTRCLRSAGAALSGSLLFATVAFAQIGASPWENAVDVLHFSTMCLGAATFNLLNSLSGGVLIFFLLYFVARWATKTDPQILRLLLAATKLRERHSLASKKFAKLYQSDRPRHPAFPERVTGKPE
jgi:hypothetical protein